MKVAVLLEAKSLTRLIVQQSLTDLVRGVLL